MRRTPVLFALSGGLFVVGWLCAFFGFRDTVKRTGGGLDPDMLQFGVEITPLGVFGYVIGSVGALIFVLLSLAWLARALHRLKLKLASDAKPANSQYT